MYHYSAHMDESSQTPAIKALNADEKEETTHVKQPKRNRKKKQQQNDVITESQEPMRDNEAIAEQVQDNVVEVVEHDVEFESQEKSTNQTPQEEEICAQPEQQVTEEPVVVAEEPVVEQEASVVAEEPVVVAEEPLVVAEEPVVEPVVVVVEESLVEVTHVEEVSILRQPELRAKKDKEEETKFVSLMENMCVPKKWWEFWK